MEHLNTTSNLFKAKDVAEAVKEARKKQQEQLGATADQAELSVAVTPEQAETSFITLYKKLIQASRTRGLLIALLGGSLANTLVLGLVDVIAISGFVGNIGTKNLPWLWIGELLFSLVISGVVLQVVDSIPRIKMMRWMLVGLTVTYAILAGMFLLKIPTNFLYPVMYLIYAQQAIIFPMAFWNVANTVYSLAEARKLFPVLSSGELLGRLIGYSIFTLTGLLGYSEISHSIIQNPAMIMVFSAALFLIGQIAFRKIKDEAGHEKSTKHISFSANIKSGFETIREVPFFRNMAALVAFTWIALTILLFNFYTSIDEATAQGFQFQTVYSIYNITVLFIPLLFQWTFGDDLLKKISPQNGYLFLPFTLLISMGLIFFLPSLVGGISAQFIAMVMYRGWYMPLYQSLYKLVPQERRGRVRSLLGTLSYTLGSLTGALLTGGIVLVLPLLDITTLHARTVYLLAALAATFAAIYIAFRIRATYEDSLLSWRVARRTRSHELFDKLEDE